MWAQLNHRLEWGAAQQQPHATTIAMTGDVGGRGWSWPCSRCWPCSPLNLERGTCACGARGAAPARTGAARRRGRAGVLARGQSPLFENGWPATGRSPAVGSTRGWCRAGRVAAFSWAATPVGLSSYWAQPGRPWPPSPQRRSPGWRSARWRLLAAVRGGDGPGAAAGPVAPDSAPMRRGWRPARAAVMAVFLVGAGMLGIRRGVGARASCTRAAVDTRRRRGHGEWRSFGGPGEPPAGGRDVPDWASAAALDGRPAPRARGARHVRPSG